MALLSLAVSLLLALLLNLQPIAAPLEVSGTGDAMTVESVGAGSALWIQGVRPGMTARYWDDLDAGTRGVDVDVGEMTLGTELYQAPPLNLYLIAGLLLATIALFLRAARLPGSAVAAAAGVGGALLPFGPEVGVPAALPLLLLPLVPAALFVDPPAARVRRLIVALFVVSVLVIVGGGLVLMATDNGLWRDFWHLPLVLAVVLAVAGETMAIWWRFRRSAEGRIAQRLIVASVPMLAAKKFEGADEERSRLALDIHNRVLPRIESYRTELEGSGAPADSGSRLQELSSELRGLMDESQTVGLEVGGLGEALRSFADSINRSDVSLGFEIRMTSIRPPSEIEMAAYRIGQAAIDNALRHGGADRVAVTVETGQTSVSLIVEDDGVGLDRVAEKNARQRGRMGLAQMRARAAAVGGTLSIAGGPNGGTRVEFSWRP